MDLHDIVRRIGGKVYAGGLRATVPGPGHSRHDRSLSLLLNGDRVVYHSYSNDTRETIISYLGISARPESDLSKAAQLRLRKERQSLALADKRRKHAFCALIWNAAIPATGTPAHAYLGNRGIQSNTVPEALRFHPLAPRNYAQTSHDPALVALVSDHFGNPCGLHLTFLPNKSRIMFGNVTGGAVRLYQATDTLAVSEGVETAISYAALHGQPTWAVLSTSGLQSFIPPISVDHLILAIDRDDISKAHPEGAALEIARTKSFSTCRTTIDPAPLGKDWNDVL